MELTSLNKDRKKKKPSPDVSIYAKVPPNSVETEIVILGALLSTSDAYEIVDGLIKGEMFYTEIHQMVYFAIQHLRLKGKPQDIMSVMQELKFREQLEIIGGPYYLSRLTNSLVVVTEAHLESWCQTIVDTWTAREQI